jgi:hypothetical protein
MGASIMAAGIDAGNVFSTTVIRQTLTPTSVSTITTSEQTFTVPGLKVGDHVVVNPPGITTGVVLAAARVSAADTLALQFVNPTAGSVTPLAGAHTILVTRFDGTSPATRVLS